MPDHRQNRIHSVILVTKNVNVVCKAAQVLRVACSAHTFCIWSIISCAKYVEFV